MMSNDLGTYGKVVRSLGQLGGMTLDLVGTGVKQSSNGSCSWGGLTKMTSRHDIKLESAIIFLDLVRISGSSAQ